MKKVLFVATVDVHINTFHLPIIKKLKQDGYEVHVATNTTEKIENCDKKHCISIRRSPLSFSNLKAIYELKKIIKNEKIDIIHCHTPMGGVVSRLAAKSFRKKGLKIIYTAHGFHFYEGAPLINWLLYYPIEKYLSKFTDLLITINQEDFLLANKKFSKRCPKIEYVPGVGIDKKRFNHTLNKNKYLELRKEFGLSSDDFVLIFPARLDKNKNQIFLIDAFKKIINMDKHIHLLLPGADELNGFYQKIVKDNHLDNNIHFLGYRTDIADLIKISDLCVSSSLREGLPINILEALANGKYVVALKCRGMKDLIIQGKNGFIVDSVDDFISKIMLIKEKSDLKENNNFNIDKFEISNVNSKILQLYSDLYFSLVLPTCTDLNRGDQALVLETCNVIKKTKGSESIYIMKGEEPITQCLSEGYKEFYSFLKHPSRFDKKKNNINYGLKLKIKWGIVAIIDFIVSLLVLNRLTRHLIRPFLSEQDNKTHMLFENCDCCFIKGGGFLHDYSGGLIGLYTMYYQLFHIKLALHNKKRVLIMPNSFGPFKSYFSKMLVKRTLIKCDFVSARESISSNGKTNGLGLNISLFPDLAFNLEIDDKFNIEKYFNDNSLKISKKNIVGITIRPYRFPNSNNSIELYNKYKESYLKFAKYLVGKGYMPMFVVHTSSINKHEDDYECIKDIVSKLPTKDYILINDSNLNCRQIKKLYSICKFIVGTRFHSVIFGISQEIPSISVTYGGNKGDGITRDIDGGKYAIKIKDLCFDLLKEKFEYLESDSKIEKNELKKYNEKSKKSYERMLDEIRGILK